MYLKWTANKAILQTLQDPKPSPSVWTRGNGCKLEHKRGPSKYQETFLYSAGDRMPAQVAQGDWGVVLFGDIQESPGHGPGKLAINGTASAGDLDQMTSRVPFSLTVLWFYDLRLVAFHGVLILYHLTCFDMQEVKTVHAVTSNVLSHFFDRLQYIAIKKPAIIEPKSQKCSLVHALTLLVEVSLEFSLSCTVNMASIFTLLSFNKLFLVGTYWFNQILQL